jgi:hypothetical protein
MLLQIVKLIATAAMWATRLGMTGSLANENDHRETSRARFSGNCQVSNTSSLSQNIKITNSSFHGTSDVLIIANFDVTHAKRSNFSYTRRV